MWPDLEFQSVDMILSCQYKNVWPILAELIDSKRQVLWRHT